MQPSDFQEFPRSSVTKNHESEQVALNIMIILNRTGNEWRELPWVEYQKERLKDGGFPVGEKRYFYKVQPCTVTAKEAAKFCPKWRDIYLNAQPG